MNLLQIASLQVPVGLRYIFKHVTEHVISRIPRKCHDFFGKFVALIVYISLKSPRRVKMQAGDAGFFFSSSPCTNTSGEPRPEPVRQEVRQGAAEAGPGGQEGSSGGGEGGRTRAITIDGGEFPFFFFWKKKSWTMYSRLESNPTFCISFS